MQPNNINQPLPPPQVTPPPVALTPQPGPESRVRQLLHNKAAVALGAVSLLLLINLGVSAWLFTRVNHYSSLSSQADKGNANTTVPPATSFNGQNTIYIDSQSSSVGVGAKQPEGLQVDSNITQTARGTANVRAGLLNGQPTVIFEDSKAEQVQVGINGGALQLASGSAVYATAGKNGFSVNNSFSVQGNTTLGKSSSSSFTVNAANLTIPNNLNIGSNALYVANNGQGVAIGTNNTSGYKLYVAGSQYVSGSIQTASKITIPSGSAASPTITFSGNTNTGLFSPGSNIVSLSAGGAEQLRVKSGNVSTQNGADLDVAGYLQAGSGGPTWKVARYTGALDGSGTGIVSHGVSNAQRRVLVAMAWYEGSTGQAKFLSVDYIDGTHMQVSGGIPGAAWRGVLIYTSDTAGW